MKAQALYTNTEFEVVEAIADLIVEIAHDMGIEDEVEGYELLVQPKGLVHHRSSSMRLCIPNTQAFQCFVKRCVHEVVHIRRTVRHERLAPAAGHHWTHPEELETELEARERVARLSKPTRLAVLKLAGILWARRRRQEELLAAYKP